MAFIKHSDGEITGIYKSNKEKEDQPELNTCPKCGRLCFEETQECAMCKKEAEEQRS